MEYAYFVSYGHNQGFGRCEVRRNSKVTTFNDIESIEKGISGNLGFRVAILNYQLLGTLDNGTTESPSEAAAVQG